MNIDDVHALATRTLGEKPLGRYETATPTEGLLLIRSTQSTPIIGSMYEPVLCLILHGSKKVVSGNTTVELAAGDALIVSHDLPVTSTITAATAEQPYVAYILHLDFGELRNLRTQVDDAHTRFARGNESALSSAPASDDLVDALGRYLALDHAGREGAVLASTVLREVYLRLLLEPHGATLRNMLDTDASASLVARAIAFIRDNVHRPVSTDDIADAVGMSRSSLHDHFRRVTSSTPLQYQKELRLLEARRLLAADNATVTGVALEVGYSTANQFSREYSRRYGVSPSAHLRRRRSSNAATV